MELSITAVTANRTLGKALVRNRTGIDLLQLAFTRIEFSNVGFGVFQLVLTDKPKGTASDAKKEPRGDIYQLSVGVGTGDFLAFTSEEFLAEVAFACRSAITAAHLDEESRAAMFQCLADASSLNE
jgi:hypothetical protein